MAVRMWPMQTKAMYQRVVVGMSGASGVVIGLRIVELLAATVGFEVHLVVTRSGERTIAHEVGPHALARLPTAVQRHDIDDIGASIASGSFRTKAMVVAPCSMHSLSAIASSHAKNLLLRAADVHLKERRRLVLVTRETPLHLGHIQLMAAVTSLGAIIAPPMPAFYLRPASIDEMVEHCARRTIDLLGLQVHNLAPEWGGDTLNGDPHAIDAANSPYHSR